MPEPTRTDRRRAQTRAALIAAAQRLLAEGRTEVSVQEITATADVGLGSFYNHFADKAELWKAALRATTTAHGELVATLTHGMTDPAEVFCVGLRLTGRLQRTSPELLRILLHVGIGGIAADRGLGSHAMKDLSASIAAGRFDVSDPRLAWAMTTGALLGLVAVLDADPSADAEALADEMARRLLVAFGLSRAEARRMASRPLPELSAVAG